LPETWRPQDRGGGEKQRRENDDPARLQCRAIRAARALLIDESGQTMLEYIVIVVFVVIVMFIAFRMVGPMIHRNITRASASIER
jgi:Flp pilus assembly pilin Flp